MESRQKQNNNVSKFSIHSELAIGAAVVLVLAVCAFQVVQLRWQQQILVQELSELKYLLKKLTGQNSSPDHFSQFMPEIEDIEVSPQVLLMMVIFRVITGNNIINT